MITLDNLLNQLYDLEMNIKIYSFFDSGWTFELGDEMNGFEPPTTVDTIDELKDAIITRIVYRHYGL